MAQTSSAQREPSMEEILASIRRIIEDSDTVTQPGEEDAKAAARQTLVDEDGETAPDDVEAFQAEFDAVAEPAARRFEQEEPEPAMQEPLSMAEIQASVTRKPAEIAELRHFRGAEPSAPEFEPREAPAAESAFPETAEEVHEPALPAAARAIISDRTGKQVAAAFGELSEAFAASRRRSFDEMAEEMLRPMLQDWLDNNLPTLVEKLVREEIERIARGEA
jgi:cell pole-organizing protein PopZ